MCVCGPRSDGYPLSIKNVCVELLNRAKRCFHTDTKAPPTPEALAVASAPRLRHTKAVPCVHSIGRCWQLKPCLAAIAAVRQGRRRRGRDRLGTDWRLGRRRRTRGGRRIVWGHCTEGIGLGGDHRVRQVDPEGLVLLLALPAVVKGRPCYSMPQGAKATRMHDAQCGEGSARRLASGKRDRGHS